MKTINQILSENLIHNNNRTNIETGQEKIQEILEKHNIINLLNNIKDIEDKDLNEIDIEKLEQYINDLKIKLETLQKETSQKETLQKEYVKYKPIKRKIYFRMSK